MKNFSIKDIPEFSKSEKILVVGIIGKSPYRCLNKATSLLNNVNKNECQIECQWNANQNVLYLHLSSYFDTYHLTKYISELGTKKDPDKSGIEGIELAREAGDYLVATGDLTAEVARSFLLMFHLCHVILLSMPTPVFDLSYLHLFKAMDSVRLEVQPKIGELICDLVGEDWANQGRPCCPRVLFYFDSCPRQLRAADISRVKKLEHSIEDQIYHILRKCRIITNICANSLFAIPKNEEFVYVNSERKPQAGEISSMVRALVLQCQGGQLTLENCGIPAIGDTRPTLKGFLQTHLDLAFSSGFDDNVGKFAMGSSFFEVPSAQVWRSVATVLAKFFLEPGSDEQWPGALWDSVAVDTRFSQARCAKVLPIAQASYTEGLPPHYSSQHHLQKVLVAVGVFDTMGRGPLCAAVRARLQEACTTVWRSRRLCEALSLTANPCIKPSHSADASDDSHSSGVRYVSACDCGRSKATRDDPYSVKRANHTFYRDAASECLCGDALERISFPVFQPSICDFKAASLKQAPICIATNPATPTTPHPDSAEDRAADCSAPADQWSQPEELSVGSDTRHQDAEGKEATEAEEKQAHYELIPIEDDGNKDKGLVRQPSTTEYLPGMLHTESPPGLLPAFPSWSLVCLGASSLYSHNIGLPEHLHPGFLPHTNFLLPWDCAVRLDQVSAWRSAQAASRGTRAKPGPQQLTVKIFLGIEYECPRGHRFMMSGPETVVNGSVLSKESGARLANTDMPVYYHCPCRGSKMMLAQVMRVHIVSPKAPVHITLNPKIQPVLGGPTFIPGCESPVKLSGSAYWVLRLPYIYSSEHGPLTRPTVPVPINLRGRLLASMIGVTD